MPSRFSRTLRAVGRASLPSSLSSGTRRWRSLLSSWGPWTTWSRRRIPFARCSSSSIACLRRRRSTERAELNLEEVDGRERLERQLRDALATASDTERCFNTAAEHFRQSAGPPPGDHRSGARQPGDARSTTGRGGSVASGRAAARGRDDTAAAGSDAPRGKTRPRSRQSAAARAALEQRVAELERRARASRHSAFAGGDGGRRATRPGWAPSSRSGWRTRFRSRDDLTHQLREATAALEEVPARSRDGIRSRRRAPQPP